MRKLEEEYSNILLQQPESGMGYQIVEVTLAEQKKEYCIVYNTELLISFDELKDIVEDASYNPFIKESEKSILRGLRDSSWEIKELKVISKYSFPGFAFIKSKETEQAPIEHTKEDELFKRFSAYENDKRVTPDWGLLPGTYATTEKDAENIKTGLDAVARYALPNPKPAIYLFTIGPPEDTEVQYGIARPANNQPGGGVEVFFKNGTPKDTVYPPYRIPEG